MSAIRAGLVPRGADLFADQDLCSVAPVRLLAKATYPANVDDVVAEAADGPWCYTGAIENHPDLVDRLCKSTVLWGNGADVLRRVRDPLTLSSTLREAGVPCAECAVSLDARHEGRWLSKPIRSGAGHGIDWSRSDALPEGRYWQRFVEGISVSGIFAGVGGNCHFLGATRQLVGCDWLHAPAWHYCGSIGPRHISDQESRDWQKMGDELVRSFGLCGLFGVDAILNEDGPRVIEVNPRYTASIEILEHGFSFASFQFHSVAFGLGNMPTIGSVHRCVAKAIYFAPKLIRFPSEGPWDSVFQGEFDPWKIPMYADIPAPGSIIEPGQPVMTIFAEEPDAASCERSLHEIAKELDRLLER